MLPTDPQFDSPTILMPQVPVVGTAAPAVPGGGLPPGMPATLSFSGEEALFEQRLTAVLTGTVEGLPYDLADLFLLDDRTAELRVAASTAANKARPRPIEDASADLTAMAGEAVVLEGRELMPQYDVPRRCGSAVCVPVASDRTIHGTLWLYGKQPREISDPELQLVEIIAGRLAVEVERHELLRPTTQLAAPSNPPSNLPSMQSPLHPDLQQELLLPSLELEYEELQIAGHTDGPSALHDWLALPDGRVLTYAAAFVEAPGLSAEEARLTLQAARIALRAHAEGAANAGRLLNRVADTLSEAGSGSAGVSLAAALINPETGEGSYALAGAAMALRIRASQQTALVTEDPPVGWDAEQSHRSEAFELEIRERLVLAVGNPRRLDARSAGRIAKGFALVTADEHRRMNAWGVLDVVGQRARLLGVELDAAVALRRR